MNMKRACEILNTKKICNVFYKDNPVWIQEVNNTTAKVGFIYEDKEKDISINDLYETNL
ncbi:MAG: small, acid-soluble spore protein, H family [Clostridiaceae bacterium]|nr:small, acid-soluble spore protein, H family [Clostridiaceae bacterium]